MPYIDVRTSASTSPKVRDKLLADLISAAAKHLDKPEEITMGRIAIEETMLFKGSAPTAFVSVQAIGLPDRPALDALVKTISVYLEDVLGIPSDRVFVVFDDVPANRWGVRGGLLG